MILRSHQKRPAQKPDNWKNHEIGEHMIFSHRITEYTAATFPESLHFHDYYELVIYMEGTIRYICESRTLLPEPGDIIISRPSALHTSTLIADSQYSRYVFYLYPNAFDACQGSVLMQFLQSGDSPYIYLKKENRKEMFALLSQIEMILISQEPQSKALAFSYILQLFHLINRYCNDSSKHDPHFPTIVMEIKGYIDENFASIQSIAQIADDFYYSREYISRLFKRFLNTSIKEYLQKRRIAWAKEQLNTQMPISDICQHAGFHSMSAFISTFSMLTGMPPSKFRRLLQEDQGRSALPGQEKRPIHTQ